ncbi:MAG: hypothetical protein K0S39_4016 [Paenibacillus sp.]|jgi:hypothetical protein|nr:hypothetical protein [Paenibacillus sp.]
MTANKVIVFGVDGLIPELVHKFCNEGVMPHVSRMLREGASSELLPFISAWGDVNFVSLLSGQAPGTCWRGQGMPQTGMGGLLGEMDRESSRAALVHFPCSIQTEGTGHFVYAPFRESGTSAFNLASPALHSTRLEERTESTQNEILGWPPQKSLAYHLKSNRRLIRKYGDQFVLTIDGKEGRTTDINIIPGPVGTVQLQVPGTLNPILIGPGEWSEWVRLPMGSSVGIVRFRLLQSNMEKGDIEILQSQMNSAGGFSNDPNLERLVHERCGRFISKWTVSASPDSPYADTAFEEGEYQAEWLAKAALALLDEGGCDLFATVFRLNDETHHTCLGEYDPYSPFYSSERSKICEEIMRRSYMVLDRAIGMLLNGKSPETVLLLVSDHGNVPNTHVCDIYRRLEECGLAELDESGLPVMEKTKAYLKAERGGLEVYINLQGREPQGIVPPAAYDEVQSEIYRALSSWSVETRDGLRNVTGLTLRKQDASMVGYWGEEMGDVIFAYSLGFVWGSNMQGESVAPVSSPGANHGPQIPTAATGHSSNYGISLWHGPSIREGYNRNRSTYGPYRMNDVGATIGRLLGVNSMETLDGSFMHDILADKSKSFC